MTPASTGGSTLAFVVGVFLILITLWDAFETVILPRSVTRLFRLVRTLNAVVWPAWRSIFGRVGTPARRERLLAFYGPLSIIALLVLWGLTLLVGFAFIGHGMGSPWDMRVGQRGFGTDLYVSGTTLFTLGLGDVLPTSAASRVFVVVESGTGLAFLTVSIAYLPVLYQVFSRREAQITILDAWAGSPPSGLELLRRLQTHGALPEVQTFLREWERWSAEVLEAHISYPQVAFFRSQHGRQSWVASLGAVLDASAVVLVGLDGVPTWQARVTFAIARHAVVDLSQVLSAPGRRAARMTAEPSDRIIAEVQALGIFVNDAADAARRLTHYRGMYEPYLAGLAERFAFDVPRWIRDGTQRDNWEASPKAHVEAHL